jgi:transcription initiation factor TFIID TATA-box-binding protein
MDHQIQTHPQTATQAKSFIAPGSLSFPGGAGDLTPPSTEVDKRGVNGQQGAQGQNGNGVTPATPAATPGATTQGGVSGIVPTLQYV